MDTYTCSAWGTPRKQTLSYEVKRASCYNDDCFGTQYAKKLFGKDIVNYFPKKVKGKRKGDYKVYLEWVKVNKGGYHNQRGMVVNYKKKAVLRTDDDKLIAMIGYDNGNALLISSDYEFSGVGNTAYFTEHKNCGDYDSICHIVNSQDCIRKWEKRYYANQSNEKIKGDK